MRLAQAGADEAAAREARRSLEEAVRAEGEALARVEAESSPPPSAAGAVALRQRVRLPSGATGVVLELRPDGRAVVGAGAVRLLVDSGSLTPITGKFPDRALLRPSASPPNDAAAPLEIDLRGLRGEEAETATLSALDAAILADHPFLRIIHGMGTGVVRERVRQVLKSDRRVAKFAFAPRNRGGSGVTLVEFRTGT